MLFRYYFVFINGISFFCYGFDKWMAIRNKRRLSEKFLFWLSFVGGSVGSLFGMILFRHKIRKFLFYLWNISMLFLWIYVSVKVINSIS